MRSSGSGGSGGQKTGNDYQFDFGLGLSSSKPLASLKDNKPQLQPQPQQVLTGFASIPAKPSASWAPSYQTPLTHRGSQSQVPAGWAPGTRPSSLTGTSVAAKVDTTNPKGSSGSGGGRDVFGDLLNHAMRDGPLNPQSSSPAPASNSLAGMKASSYKSGPQRHNVPLSSARSSGVVFPPPAAVGVNKQAPSSSNGHSLDDIFIFPSSTRSSASSPAVPTAEAASNKVSESASSTMGNHIDEFFSFPATASTSSASASPSVSYADPFDLVSATASTSSGSASPSVSYADPFDLVSASYSTGVAATSSSHQKDEDPFGLDVLSGTSAPASDPFVQSTSDLLGGLGIGAGKSGPTNVKAASSSSKPSTTAIGGLESLLSDGQGTDSSKPLRSGTTQAARPDSTSELSFDGWEQLGGTEPQGGDTLTTELEGLGPPPAGVTAVVASKKGQEFFRQGQFPDAIKWLCWSVDLWQRAGNNDLLKEDLTCRISCYKEVGEYRKAVTDCSKVLEIDKLDTGVLLQRAFLYESMEKYRPSVEDFREVLRRDPNHKLAANTLSRLTKMMARPSFNL